MIEAARAANGIAPRPISAEETRQRLLAAIATEGLALLLEGVAARASDIDLVMISGYGFPAHTGGPMYVAERSKEQRAIAQHGLIRLARITGMGTAGVPPRIMGIGPVPAVQKLLERTALDISTVDVIELNNAFAAQALACLRQLGVPDHADFVNPNGGATLTAALELALRGGRCALVAMCIGVGHRTLAGAGLTCREAPLRGGQTRKVLHQPSRSWLYT